MPPEKMARQRREKGCGFAAFFIFPARPRRFARAGWGRLVGTVPVPQRGHGRTHGSAPTGDRERYPIQQILVVIETRVAETATPTAFIGGNPSPATRAARSGGPYGGIWGGFVLPETFCYPTLASPLPPSYEEGAPRRGRARFFEPVPSTHFFCPSLREGCPSEAMGRVGASILPVCVIRRRGRRPRRPAPPITTNFRFIGPVPVTQRGTGGHMGPPLRGMWEVIPFNRHRWLSKRGSPRTATPTAFIGGNPSPATRAARSGGPHVVSFVYRKRPLRPTGSNTPAIFRKRGRGK